jgi:hypothetical protein
VSRLFSKYDHAYGASARILQRVFQGLAVKAEVRTLASLALKADAAPREHRLTGRT